MVTTAKLRQQAREAEERLDWFGASNLYDQAIRNYPTKIGELARSDIAILAMKRDEAIRMIRR